MKFTPPKSKQPLRYGQKPCPKCGAWVSHIDGGPAKGRAYNDDGTWHKCKVDPNFVKKEKLRRAEWEAKNLIKPDDRRESRGFVPAYMRRG